MRAFFAIEFPDRLKRVYAEALPGFRDRFPGLRWVRPESIHLTMRFLGEIEEAAATDLEAPVAAVAREIEPCPLSLGAPGSFGPPSAPRVFWLAVDTGREALETWQPRLERAVLENGHAPDNKPWKSHVTLARNRGGRRDRGGAGEDASGSAWREAASASELPGGSFSLTELTLMSSRLTPQGPIYSPVWKVKLGANA